MTKNRPARSAGVLLHPTSLPGPYGIGDLGPWAYKWVDWLTRAGQTWWQVLPLGPTGYGDSPYSSFSAFAGNPYLVSPDALVRDGLLSTEDLAGVQFSPDHVDYGTVGPFKLQLLGRAWENFRAGKAPALRPRFDDFCRQEASWLDDFALFQALKDHQGGATWFDWPAELRLRDPVALRRLRPQVDDARRQYQFHQFLFFRQWRELREYAHGCGIRLIGDIPIFVSVDSADVWANPKLFQLDAEGRPTAVAGVPPDYFAATGQLWGNPLYRWDELRRTGYAWWVERVRATLRQVDFVRLDHFRGFEAYWAVPAGMPTAEIGRWVPGPGADLFETLRSALGGLPMIAEDLGLITPEVEALRDQLGLPGMRVLHFAFSGSPEERFLPHNYDELNAVAYTGTHDNDTTLGWYASLGEKELHFLQRYLPPGTSDISWALIRLAWSSVADYALAPLQDLLSLGSEARMNMPGRPAGNWGWRFTPELLTDAVRDRLADITEVYGRNRA